MHDEYEFDVATELHDLENRLVGVRPDRYKTGDLRWADDIISEARDLIVASPERLDRAAWNEATAWARSIERRHTSQANDLMRTIARTGAMPLDWMDYINHPIVIDQERFKLGSCRPASFKEWELHERRRAAHDAQARYDACDGAQIVHDWMIAGGIDRFRDLGGEA